MKICIGNVFTQQLVKSLDLSKKHKPYIVEYITPKIDYTKPIKVEELKPTIKLHKEVVTERFLKLWDKDKRYKLEFI